MERDLRISIIDREETVSGSLRLILDSSREFSVVGVYSSAGKALDNLIYDIPEVVIFDPSAEIDGELMIQRIKQRIPRVEILVFSDCDDSKVVFDVLKAGASGFISKGSGYNEVIEALYELMRGGAPMSTHIGRLVVQSFQRNLNSPLSRRETDVLELLATGKTYEDVAERLHVGIETVKTHTRNIYTKLQAKNKSEALKIAEKDRLI